MCGAEDVNGFGYIKCLYYEPVPVNTVAYRKGGYVLLDQSVGDFIGNVFK